MDNPSKFTIVALFGALLLSGGTLVPSMAQAAQKTHHNVKKGTQQAIYTCPMHPDFVSHKPGQCPRCGMTLQEKTEKPST